MSVRPNLPFLDLPKMASGIGKFGKEDLKGDLEVDLKGDLEEDLEGDFRGDFKQDLEGDLLSSSG